MLLRLVSFPCYVFATSSIAMEVRNFNVYVVVFVCVYLDGCIMEFIITHICFLHCCANYNTHGTKYVWEKKCAIVSAHVAIAMHCFAGAFSVRAHRRLPFALWRKWYRAAAH